MMSTVSRLFSRLNGASGLPLRFIRFGLISGNLPRSCSTSLYSKVNHLRLDEKEVDSDLFAVVEIGNKQFKNDAIVADRLPPELFDIGSEALLDKVLLLGCKSQTLIGQPYLSGACVKVSVEEHKKDKKIIVFRKNRRKGFKRTKGHRRVLSILRVIGISDPRKYEFKFQTSFHQIIPASITQQPPNIVSLDTTALRKGLESLILT